MKHPFAAFNILVFLVLLGNWIVPVPKVVPVVPILCQGSYCQPPVYALLPGPMFPPFLVFLWLAGNVFLAFCAVAQFISSHVRRLVS
jgi:hypothetical protein